MKLAKHIFNELFDFFCGDWRIFWGIAITICLVILSSHISPVSHVNWLPGIIFVIGILLSLIIALKREIPDKKQH